LHRSDYNISLVLIAFGIFIFISSYSIPVLTIIEKTGMVNSQFFPKLCGIFLVLFSIAMILENYLLMAKKEKKVWGEYGERSEKFDYIKLIVVAALGFMYLITYQYLGHLISSFLFVCLFMYFLGIRNLFLLIIAPGGISFLIYAVFRIFLDVPLPEGIITF